MKINNLSMIVSMITGIITTIITIYSINKPASHLTAYVTDNIFYTPPQYNEIMSLTLDEADYNNIYDRIDSVAQNARFEEKSKFVKEIINSILTPLENKNVAIRTLNIEIVNDAANPLSPHPQ